MPEEVNTPKVEDVMNKNIVFVEPGDSIVEAAEKLEGKKGTGSLIVKEGGEVLGILTHKDIVDKYVVRQMGDKVRDIMSPDLVTVSPNKNIEEAALIMVKQGVERLPVKKGEDLKGIISANEIIKVQPSLYLELSEGLKLGEERFQRASPQSELGRCESCENFSENLEEANGQMICEECREEMAME